MPTRHGGSFSKNARTVRRFNWRRISTWSAASTPWTWKTDFAMSRPIVVTVCMGSPPNSRCISSNHSMALRPGWRSRPQHRKLTSGPYEKLVATGQREQVHKWHHYSLVSSARTSTAGGTSRPSTLAVLRSITVSYLGGRLVLEDANRRGRRRAAVSGQGARAGTNFTMSSEPASWMA